VGDDDIDTEPHEFFSEFLSTIGSPIGLAELNLDVLAIRVAEGVQAAPEDSSERMQRRRRHQRNNKGQFPRVLSSHRGRPHEAHAAEQV
jgi:hypothetical protein